jgi:hypothetical protein
MSELSQSFSLHTPSVSSNAVGKGLGDQSDITHPMPIPLDDLLILQPARLGLRELYNCEEIVSKNWYCGGETLLNGYTIGKNQVIVGNLSYETEVASLSRECPQNTIVFSI